MDSWYASRFRALGANQRDDSHCLIAPLACCCETPNGKTASGATMGSAAFGCAPMVAPQNEHSPATSGGVKVMVAPHCEQVTSTAFTAREPICAAPAFRYVS